MEKLHRSDIEGLLGNAAYKAFRSDMVERRTEYLKLSAETLLTTPEEVAKANKRVGQIEEIDFMLVFPELVLTEIEEEEKEGKRNGTGN